MLSEMFLIRISFKFVGYLRKSSFNTGLLNYTKLDKQQALNVRWRCNSGNLKNITTVQVPSVNFEGGYFENLMSDSLKYPACNFTIDRGNFNKNTSNGFVLMLRELARGEGCQTSEVHDLPAIENFQAHVFTQEDFLEVLHLLSIPEVASRVTYNQEDLFKFLITKYLHDEPISREDPDKLLCVLHLLRKANLHKSNITFFVVRSLRRKYKKLTNSQIIELYYFLSVHRINFTTKELKYYIEEMLVNKLSNFTCDEIAVIAYAFFRGKKFPSAPLTAAICQRIEDEITNLNDVQATVFSKFIRLCGKRNQREGIRRILEKCVPLVEKFTLITLIHVSCSGISHCIEPTELLTRVLKRTKEEITAARLKDLERLLLACLYSNIRLSEESEIVKVIVENLESRESEIEEFPRAFWSLLQYLIIYGIYVENRISSALSGEVIRAIPSNRRRSKMHELLFIDASVEIERPNYEGNRLPELLRKKISVNYASVLNATRDSAFKCIISITKMLENIYGHQSCKMKGLLPHYATYHPVLCFNENGEAQHLEDKLDKPSGTVIRAPNDGNHWLCFVLVRLQGYLSDGTTPNLVTAAKLRHFKAIGYTPILISHNEWIRKTENMKDICLREAVRCALINGNK